VSSYIASVCAESSVIHFLRPVELYSVVIFSSGFFMVSMISLHGDSWIVVSSVVKDWENVGM